MTEGDIDGDNAVGGGRREIFEGGGAPRTGISIGRAVFPPEVIARSAVDLREASQGFDVTSKNLPGHAPVHRLSTLMHDRKAIQLRS